MEAEQLKHLTENDKTVGWQQVRTGAEKVSYSVMITLIYNEPEGNGGKIPIRHCSDRKIHLTKNKF